MADQFGETATLATKLYKEGGATSPKYAWKMAAQQLISSKSSREKSCPKNAYLGLCAAGLVCGIPSGDYVESNSQEKQYATTAVDILRQNPEKAENLSALWRDVLKSLGEDPSKAHDSQMNIVVELWKDEHISRS